MQVRTCAEGLSEPPDGGDAARAIQQWVVTKRPDSSTSGDVVSAGPSVRVSPLWTKHESSPLGGLLVSWMRLPSPAKQVCGGVTRRQWFINFTGEVPRRRSFFFQSVEEAIRHRPKGLFDAAARRTVLFWPPPWGWQQTRSSPLSSGRKGKP